MSKKSALRPRSIQPHLPRLEADGATHQRDCECPRCDAGFQPSEDQRARAQDAWERRQEERKTREAAALALARQRERARKRALQLHLSLMEDRERALHYIAAQEQALERLREDERLDALLSLRRAGKPVQEAVAEVDRRFSARAAERG